MQHPNDKLECVYCGSDDVEPTNAEGVYKCRDCWGYFTDDDIEDGPREHRREPKHFDDERY